MATQDNSRWDRFKKGFDKWEANAATVIESIMKKPEVIEPAGAALSAVMKLRAANQAALAAWWSTLGLPTKRDQERTLHLLNRLETRILDLEDKLADSVAPQGR